MSIFNGKYQWDGTKKNGMEPIAWFPGSYDVKIMRQPAAGNQIEQLKSHICLYSRTGDGQSISANPEKFAKRLCFDFALEIDRVFWVEDLLTEQDRYEVVVFIQTGKMGNNVFYRIEKRRALAREVKMIEQTLAHFAIEQTALST